MVLDERVTGYQWADYMNNCWLVANRVQERYDPWRGIVHAGLCGELGESLGSYPNGAILLASICVFSMIFAAGLCARALGGSWAGMLAAVSLSMVPTVSEAVRWGNSTPVIAAGTALAIAFGACAVRWPHWGWALATGLAACLGWATDKRGLLVVPGALFLVLISTLIARRMEESDRGVERPVLWLWLRFPQKLRERVGSFPIDKPLKWMVAHQRRLLMIPVLCLGLLVFPVRDALLGESTNLEWQRHMDAESMRQVHDGTAQRWTQNADLDRAWSDWSLVDPHLGRFVPPYTSVIRKGGSPGRDKDLMERCKELSEDEFLVIPDFFYTDCARATLAHNTRESLGKLSFLPLGLVWISLPLCLLPARRGWRGALGGLGLLAAVWSMWVAMASLNVMPTRYLIQFAMGAAVLAPVGIGRLVHSFVPRTLAWGVSGLCCIGLYAWGNSLDINDRASEHTWAYNRSFLDDYYDETQQLLTYLEPEDDYLDCSDKGINIWLLPDYTRFGTPMLKVDDAGRCMQWIGWEPENGTRWMSIDPSCKYRPQDSPQAGRSNNQDNHVSLEPALESSGWEMVLDLYPEEARKHRPAPGGSRNQLQCGEGRFQLWKRAL
jgi:hypothetical protein